MRAIFLSYRRDDSEGEAGRLFDDLVGEFGADKVFMDVAGIEPGRDFRKVIDQNVASCGVLLAMIGKNWIDAKDESGRRRLDDPVDFVRLETASALTRDIPVVPVLVHGGRMPRSEQLPEDLKDLAYRNAVELTHARWASDVQVLIKALRSHVSGGEGMVLDPPPIKSSVRASNEMGVGPTISPSPTQQTKKSWRAVVVAAVAAIVIAAGVVGLNEYKKAEEARISRAAAEAAAKQAAEDQRVAVDKEAPDRAAKQQAADQAAARKVAVEQAAARKAAAEKAAADQEAARKKRQSAPSEVDGELFLAENRTKAGVIALPSGLQYKIVKTGYGPKPTATDSVTCNYRGRFIDGTEFDSSYKRGQPATFPLAAVIKGWTEALQLMPVGSKWVVYVPPRLAYGNRGVGNVIGPGATLIFEIELVSIKGRDTK